MQSYLNLIRDVLSSGETHEDRTGVGTVSVFGRQWRHSMKEGFPLLTTKAVPLRWVFEELRWFLSGSTNNNDLKKMGVDIWDEWADEHGELGPVYGKQWRNFDGSGHRKGVDQIAGLMLDLGSNPQSRRHIVSAWHPEDVPNMALPPCHFAFQVKCHGDDEMSLKMSMRSADLFLGVPFNIASYGLLLEMLCHVTGRRARDLIIDFGDLHIYSNHMEQVTTQIRRGPYPLPDVTIDTQLSGNTLEDLLDIRWDHINLLGYDHHPKLPAPVAV